MNTIHGKSNTRRTLTALLWLPPVAVGAMYAAVWSHLPTSGFGFPNTSRGWGSRTFGLIGSLVVMGGFAILGTSALSYFTKPDFASYVAIGFFYLNEWAHLYAEYLLISIYTNGTPSAIAPVLIGSTAAAITIVSLGLLSRNTPKRGSSEVGPQ